MRLAAGVSRVPETALGGSQPANPGSGSAPFPESDPLLQPLDLRRDQLRDIEAFLRTL